jgi:peptidoglycan/LPS O-acetylase OafA/YrhL
MRRIPSLDGLRAVSILFVLLGHSVQSATRLANVAHHLAMLGVRIFFVISGFLITSILAKEADQTGGVDFKRFYVRRAWRLMPAFYAYLLFALGMTICGLLPLHAKDFAFAAGYIMNYYPAGGPWAVGHFWSLSVEEQFYFVWPVVFVFAGLRRAPRTLTSVLVAAPLVRFALLPWKHSLGPTYGTMFPCICDTVAAGCLLALVRARLHRRPEYLGFLRSGAYLLLLPAALGLELLMPEALSVVIGPSLTNIAIVVLMDGCMTFDKSWIARPLNTRLLATAGVMSYSIYLWQQPFLNHEQRAVWTTFPLNIVLALTLASLSYFLIEKPFLAYGRKPRAAERQREESPLLATQ